MTWDETNTALQELQMKFCSLPARTKENCDEYEILAKPLRAEAVTLFYKRIEILRKFVI